MSAGEGRKLFVTTVQKTMREAAMVETLKSYAALPVEWRRAIAHEAGVEVMKLSQATQAERREMQRAARRLADKSGMGYMVKAVIILSKSCTE